MDTKSLKKLNEAIKKVSVKNQDKYPKLSNYIAGANKGEFEEGLEETKQILNGEHPDYHISKKNHALFKKAENIITNHHKWNEQMAHAQGSFFADTRANAAEKLGWESSENPAEVAAKHLKHHPLLGSLHDKIGNWMYQGSTEDDYDEH